MTQETKQILESLALANLSIFQLLNSSRSSSVGTRGKTLRFFGPNRFNIALGLARATQVRIYPSDVKRNIIRYDLESDLVKVRPYRVTEN